MERMPRFAADTRVQVEKMYVLAYEDGHSEEIGRDMIQERLILDEGNMAGGLGGITLANKGMSCDVCMQVCMYVCRYVGMYVCMFVCMYVCLYLCMYGMYVCLY
jgi:hypothetical protein